jgi:hypothetical protein
MNKIQNDANSIAKKCSKCSGCFESEDTFAVAIQQDTTSADSQTLLRQKNNRTLLMPLANCVCIDCPTTYERHRLREQSIEAIGTYDLVTANIDRSW